jgi:hypothetical protein
LGALALLALNYLLVSFLLSAPTAQRVAIPYTVFKQQVDASNVAAITATADQIQGRLKQAISYTPPSTGQAVQVTTFATVQPTFSDPGLEALLEQQGVVVNATSSQLNSKSAVLPRRSRILISLPRCS